MLCSKQHLVGKSSIRDDLGVFEEKREQKGFGKSTCACARVCVRVCMQCELKTKQTSKQAAVEGWAGLKKRGEWAIRGK